MVTTITGYTAARMKEIEDNTIIDGFIAGDNLILTRYDQTQINAGSVRGPVGPANPNSNPAGTLIMGGWTSNFAGYLLLNGQTVFGGVAANPTVAGMYPSWVSGPDLVLPDTVGSVPMGGNTPGFVSGSMTHTLTSDTQLPSHNHTGPSHTHPGPNHYHSIGHGHALSITSDQAGHIHTPSFHNAGDGFVVHMNAYAGANGFIPVSYIETTTPPAGYINAAFGWGQNTASADPGITSTNTLTPAPSTTISGGPQSATTLSTGAATAGNTGNKGSSAPINHTPRNIQVVFAVKTG